MKGNQLLAIINAIDLKMVKIKLKVINFCTNTFQVFFFFYIMTLYKKKSTTVVL